MYEVISGLNVYGASLEYQLEIKHTKDRILRRLRKLEAQREGQPQAGGAKL